MEVPVWPHVAGACTLPTAEAGCGQRASQGTNLTAIEHMRGLSCDRIGPAIKLGQVALPCRRIARRSTNKRQGRGRNHAKLTTRAHTIGRRWLSPTRSVLPTASSTTVLRADRE